MIGNLLHVPLNGFTTLSLLTIVSLDEGGCMSQETRFECLSAMKKSDKKIFCMVLFIDFLYNFFCMLNLQRVRRFLKLHQSFESAEDDCQFGGRLIQKLRYKEVDEEMQYELGIIGQSKDIYSDGVNIDDLTIEQYLRLTQENQTPSMVKKVDDMTISEYIKYEDRMKRQYSRNSLSYFPTYFGHCTSSNNTTIEFPCNTYFNPIQPNTKFNYDSEDMELDDEAGYTTDRESALSEPEAIDPAHTVNTQSFEEELSSKEDLDEWLNAEMEKHMKAGLKKSSEAMEDTVNNDNFTSNLPSLEELNPGSFLLPFIINNYNSYVMANIDASNNVMPKSIYEYLKLANLGGATMSAEMDDMTKQETLEL
ncbi:hypothetical protein Tco_0576148 [Tanacetum coccineum]